VEIRIRRGAPADLDRVVEIENHSFTHQWSREALASELVRHPRRLPLVAVDADQDDRVVGYALVWIVAEELHIVNLAVDPDRRREGIASALMDEILGGDAGRSAGVVTLEVRAGNEAAIALYRRFGFYEVAMRPRYYPDDGEDAVVMLKPLRPRGDVGPDHGAF
jgi:ribosomal-protein-alanine N-acetyltransferase